MSAYGKRLSNSDGGVYSQSTAENSLLPTLQEIFLATVNPNSHQKQPPDQNEESHLSGGSCKMLILIGS
jgi:hypothetical protein